MYVCKCRHVCSSGPKRGKACCQASLEQQQTFEMEYFKALLKINYTFRKQQTQRNTSLSSKLGGEPHTKQNVTNTSAVILPQAFHECHMTHPLLLPHLEDYRISSNNTLWFEGQTCISIATAFPSGEYCTVLLFTVSLIRLIFVPFASSLNLIPPPSSPQSEFFFSFSFFPFSSLSWLEQ